MKKLIAIIACVLLLSGCAAKTMVSDSNTSIISGDGVNFTKQEFFERLKNNDYTQVIVNSLYEKIAVLEGLDENTINEGANSSINELKEQYGDAFSTVAAYYGGEDTLFETMKINEIIKLLSDNYFTEHKDELIEEYIPVKAKVIYFDELEAAQAMIEEINNGTSFEMAAAHQGYSATIADTVYTDKSDISYEVKNVLQTATEPMLSNVILSVVSATDSSGNTTSANRYYVVEVTDVDPENFLDDFYAALSDDYDSTKILDSYLAKYDVQVYDQRTYDLMIQTYEEFK